jgi:hypothetical protein
MSDKLRLDTIRLGCTYCDREDHDGIRVILKGWRSVIRVQTLAEACAVYENPEDEPEDYSVLDWQTHLGTCPDCAAEEDRRDAEQAERNLQTKRAERMRNEAVVTKVSTLVERLNEERSRIVLMDLNYKNREARQIIIADACNAVVTGKIRLLELIETLTECRLNLENLPNGACRQ